MSGRECYHCKEWIEDGAEHDCWTTTEAALTQELSHDLRDAWERLRETASSFGDQRIYASHKSIMFSRKSCYFFVRVQEHQPTDAPVTQPMQTLAQLPRDNENADRALERIAGGCQPALGFHERPDSLC